MQVSAQEEKDFIVFEVQDNGPGIPSDAIEKVFEIFVTLDSKGKGEASGMGLALVKKPWKPTEVQSMSKLPKGKAG